jgi:hypothetical protein|tara:strand:+ start:56 stop:343 length:288 start_codon:yes stop_codon:yes gene_type:complete
MAQFCVEIADGDVERVITAMCANYGYQANIANPDYNPELPVGPDNSELITNPENSYQFTNRMGREYLMNNTVAYELKSQKESISQPTPPDIVDPQ